MERERYEIEPRPAELGGGWRLHFIGRDMETGEEGEVDSGVVPVEIGKDEKADVHTHRRSCSGVAR